MKIDLGNDESLKAIMSEALLRAIDQETRDRLIKEAIVHLTSPPANTSYGARRPSPLEEAYRWAVDAYAKRTAHEMLEKDETLQAQVKSLLNEAMERAFVTHREATVERVSNAIAEGLWKRDEG